MSDKQHSINDLIAFVRRDMATEQAEGESTDTRLSYQKQICEQLARLEALRAREGGET